MILSGFLIGRRVEGHKFLAVETLLTLGSGRRVRELAADFLSDQIQPYDQINLVIPHISVTGSVTGSVARAL